jgi:ribose/xylose/arabinose/galactoside ABC-type transport system permease subunit
MNKIVRQLLPFVSLVLIVVILSIMVPHDFLRWSNLENIFRRSSVNLIIALGMTAIIISGGIDLSVGSMLALSGMAGAWTMLHFGGDNLAGHSMWIGTFAGILTGLLCGWLNGVLLTKLKLPPFIVTLGTMSAFRGISYVMNDGQPYNVPSYTFLGTGDLLGVNVSDLISIVLVALASLVLRYTPLGRYTYSIGSNTEASYHAGVNVDRNLMAIYALGGLLVGIAAMIATSRTVSAQPTAGISLELDVIAAVVIGGASLSGGRGTILGTVIGTLLISFLRNGCTLLDISTNVQLIVIGIIIIAAVAVDQMTRTKAK